MSEKIIDNYEIEEDISIIQKEFLKFKLIVLGDTSVGKTNIIRRYTSDSFNKNTKSTVGVEFFTKSFKINNDYIKLEIWDTAGQERYKSITSAYYKGSRGALLVYDITRFASYENIDKWIEELNEVVKEPIKMILVGNKSDLKDDRKVKSDIALDKALKLNIPFLETSALYSSNINKVFEIILLDMYKELNEKRKEKNNKINLEKGIKLDINGKGNKEITIEEKQKCCYFL